MEDKLYYSALFDLYGDLLTDKQKQYFEDSYFYDLSLAEVGENYDVSRNAVHKQVKDTLHKLDFYEAKLHLYEKKKKIYDIMSKIDNNKIKEEIKELW